MREGTSSQPAPSAPADFVLRVWYHVFRAEDFVSRVSCFVLGISSFVFRVSCFVFRVSRLALRAEGFVQRVELHGNMQRFRGGLVLKAHRLCVSLNSRLESDKEEEGNAEAPHGSAAINSVPTLRILVYLVKYDSG